MDVIRTIPADAHSEIVLIGILDDLSNAADRAWYRDEGGLAIDRHAPVLEAYVFEHLAVDDVNCR